MAVRVEGLREVRRALRQFPAQATAELKDGSVRLANQLVPLIKAAGAARGKQTTIASRTTRVVKGGFLPTIVAGRAGKAGAVLYGTEFGATRHFGWYARARYFNSRGKQFPPHLGAGSYWFHKTVDDNQGTIGVAAAQMGSDLVRRWSA